MSPELTSRTLTSTYPQELLIRPSPESIPSAITHQPFRNFLVTTGLPSELRNGALDIADIEDGNWETLTELKEAIGEHGWSWTMPENPESWFYLGGFFGCGLLALNGETGEIWIIAEGDTNLTLLHTGIDSLAYYMYAIERDRKLYSRTFALSVENDPNDPRTEDDVYEEAARSLATELYEADPTPFVHGPDEPWEDNGEGPWAWILRDISEGAWSAD